MQSSRVETHPILVSSSGSRDSQNKIAQLGCIGNLKRPQLSGPHSATGWHSRGHSGLTWPAMPIIGGSSPVASSSLTTNWPPTVSSAEEIQYRRGAKPLLMVLWGRQTYQVTGHSGQPRDPTALPSPSLSGGNHMMLWHHFQCGSDIRMLHSVQHPFPRSPTPISSGWVVAEWLGLGSACSWLPASSRTLAYQELPL